MSVEGQWTRAAARVRACLLATVLLSCGGGPPSGAPAGIEVIELEPSEVVIGVGQRANLQARAVDAAGAPLPGMTFTWTSAASRIATVTSAGVVTGIVPGTTSIEAAAGGKSGLAVVVVLPGPVPTVSLPILTPPPARGDPTCGGITNIPRWKLNLSMDYARSGATPEGRPVSVEHSMRVNTTLTGTFGVWRGAPAGNGGINDATPGSTLRGAGSFLTTLPFTFGLPTNDVQLSVDPVTCRYFVSVEPFIDATLTENDRSSPRPSQIGILRIGWLDLGDWRRFGLSDVVGLDVPAHAGTWAIGENAQRTVYIPHGFGGGLFAVPGGPDEAPQGAARVTWSITTAP